MIVQATASETHDIEALLDEYYREIDVVHRDNPDAGFWIAYEDGVAAGCVALRPLPHMGNAGECKRLYVRPNFRRRGIADELIDAMEEYARSTGLEWIYLDSKDDLEAAIALYRRRGYEDCERYNENTQATVFLRKRFR